MSEEKGMYLFKEKNLTPSIWSMIREMSPIMHQSRIFGVTSADQAAAIMLKGYELGLGFTASFELIQVIDGKPALSPRGALAILHSSPEIKTIKLIRLDDKNGKFLGYECFMERVNGFSHTARFTLDDAKAAGLVKPNGNWEKYPSNMCMWRAVGFAADVVASDIIAGLSTPMKAPEVFNAGIDDGGNLVIDAVSHNTEQQPAVTVTTAPLMTLEQLLSLFGPDEVLAANGGRFPTSNEELTALGMKLTGGAA